MALIGGTLAVIVATPPFVCVKIAVDYLYVEQARGKPACRAFHLRL